MPKEWSGSPHPDAPDAVWVDDSNGQLVCAVCGSRVFAVDADFVHNCTGCGTKFSLVAAEEIRKDDLDDIGQTIQ